MRDNGKVFNLKIAGSLFLAVLIIVGVCLLACGMDSQNASAYECSSYAMGSLIEQKIDSSDAQSVAATVIEKIEKADGEISCKDKSSIIFEINSSSGRKAVKVSEDLLNMLCLCCEVSEKTSNSFNVLIQPLTKLWDFDNQSDKIPPKREIKRILPLLSKSDLYINEKGSTVFLKVKGMGIDLGAVGKGYACEQAVKLYESCGVKSALISAGSSTIGLYGQKQGDWNIAVKDPLEAVEGKNTQLGVINIKGGYVSTSGIYEKYFRKGKKIYSHILNPKTGYPVQNDIASVTVTSQSGVLADILSTACLIVGKDKAVSLLKEYSSEAIFITKDKTIYATSGLIDKITVENQDYELVQVG